MFSEGREDVNDEERAGRPSTSTTDEKINEVEKRILTNRRITVREVAEDLNISIGSFHSIFINDLGVKRVAAKFVPKLLNCDQKQHRMNIANEMLDSVRDDPSSLQRVITGDEAGVVHHEFLPHGRTVNKEYYLQVMRNLREVIRQKRLDLWKNKKWLLHHDNAPAHTSLLVRDLLAKNNTLMMPQPPYSPDLAPCDFFLFPKLKRPMKGRRYATLDEIKTASKEELKKIFKNDFLKCFEDWKNRWHKLFPQKCSHRKRRQFKQTDAFTRGMVIGLKRAARVDRRILRQAVAAPQATCTAILQHVQDTLDHSISTRTISRRLAPTFGMVPGLIDWMTEWHRVVFSDESRFCLSTDSRRVRVWRRRGERSNPAAIVERPTVRQRGIMVWGAIAYDSRSPLLRIQGTMTAQRYVDDQDNARPHTARISQQALQDVQMLPWPPYSPDLSPIEHVWDIIGRRLHALPQPRSEDELWQMVEREWRAIPQDAIRTLIDSLPRRVAACIAVRGGPTCY
ncbi:hypothetical protein LAZ67_18001018 [Cordylochernes scorpioides]|uniref:Tc1-like transposase DDE domain-containing protein n=1 Tax=Cordylochernes scorpioides TaxID=51811 RepID=A0ABY6LI08_9ARAC|nr:hypothetical protein LAZ67_18001018 [Cordylochernes scorpioides]